MTNCIVFAAGSGLRLKSTIPKACLPLRTETIGERMVRMLNGEGISDITFLVCKNYRPKFKKQIVKLGLTYEVEFPNPKVEDLWTILNSIHLANDDTLFLPSDIVFSRLAVKEILSVKPKVDVAFYYSSPELGQKWNLKYSWYECFGMRINIDGKEELENLSNPFLCYYPYHVLFPVKTSYPVEDVWWKWEDKRIGHLARNSQVFLESQTSHFMREFILDIDEVTDYERAKKVWCSHCGKLKEENPKSMLDHQWNIINGIWLCGECFFNRR